MTERITALTALTLQGEMFAHTTKTEYDRSDIFLSKQVREAKRICEYIVNQKPVLSKYSSMTGFFNFDGSCVGDAFKRGGHKGFDEIRNLFYLKPIENISTFEWQHATADFGRVLSIGIKGIIEIIDKSYSEHENAEEKEFLESVKKVAKALIQWAHICSEKARLFADTVEEPEYKNNLLMLSDALLRVPENSPQSFYEAVLCIYICFSADPDSVGTLDRYLRSFYEKDKSENKITDELAKEYLQELFLMLQAATHRSSDRFCRGGESHFCVGGYSPDGNDSFDSFSKLILESLTELPTFIPQVTFRWTKKTPKETLRYVMDLERKDPHKRIAFTNDEKRIKCYTEICGIPFEQAVSYTTIGCNEPAFTGAITGSNSKINLPYSLQLLFTEKKQRLLAVTGFEELYKLFEDCLISVLDKCYRYDDLFNLKRAEDINYISSLFFRDCVENAKSLTRGGGNTVIASPMMMGITNVIDSLIVVKQFVFDDKLFSMKELSDAIDANWNGYEDMRTLILKKGDFFGNDTERSNFVAQKLYDSFYRYLKDKKNVFGYQWLVGDLTGYNEHFKWFGALVGATPDGRYAGTPLKFGIGQSEGKDRQGLTALLNSIASVDPNAIACGSTVTNISIDEALIKNDENFEKTVDMFETYFKNGGVHFQLTYVSKEDLLAAKKKPENYGALRVRVSGFSDYFVNLNDSLQDDVIERTSHHE